jgi:hypothetical protein
MAPPSPVRIALLRDLLNGPKAGSVLRQGRTGYVWAALYKMEHDGLVLSDADTKAFEITDKGRAWLAAQEGGQ